MLAEYEYLIGTFSSMHIVITMSQRLIRSLRQSSLESFEDFDFKSGFSLFFFTSISRGYSLSFRKT
jgi:hypothetical protein